MENRPGPCQTVELGPTSCTFDVLHVIISSGCFSFHEPSMFVAVSSVLLQDDALAYVLSLLPAEDLNACETELNSNRIYNVVAEKQLWLFLCGKACPKINERIAGVDIQDLRRLLMHRAECRAQQYHDGTTSASKTLPKYMTHCMPHRKKCPSYPRLVEMSDAWLRSMLHKEIYRRLSARPATESLIADAMSSSSTGHLFGQLAGTLTPVRHEWAPLGDHSNWFWLSGGSVRRDVVHRLRYKMAHDVCVVHSISLHVLKAEFHQDNHVYAPANITFLLAASTHQVESARMGPFQVQPHAGLQTFKFDPALCLGGELLVELAGGNQRHPDTQQFHIGISYLRVDGMPVYNFDLMTLADASASICADDPEDACEKDDCTVAPSGSVVATPSAMAHQPQPGILKYVAHDSLVETGGLRARSERGRLLESDSHATFEDWDNIIEANPSEDMSSDWWGSYY